MAKFNTFSRLKNIFNRFNPLSSFKWDEPQEEMIFAQSCEKLLENVINHYPEFKNVILISIYHLFNTYNKHREYLTVLTRDNRLIVDLMEGDENNVNIPPIAKIEASKNNILVACHNHFFGAIIPSLDDLRSFMDNNCQFMCIVSCNHIGILINESDEVNYEQFVSDFNWFKEYIGFCIENERYGELDEIDMMDISEEEREKMKSVIHDEFLSENTEKFVNEFNNRFNKYNIYEIYIEI